MENFIFCAVDVQTKLYQPLKIVITGTKNANNYQTKFRDVNAAMKKQMTSGK